MLTADRLGSFEWYRFVSVPRPDKQVSPARTSPQLLASVTAAHAQLASIATREVSPALGSLWVREPEETQVQFLLGGAPFLPAARRKTTIVHDGGTQSVLHPPGSKAAPVTTARVSALLDGLPYWQRCEGAHDALAVEEADDTSAIHGPAFEDYVAHLAQPFAWLIVAEPLPFSRLTREDNRLVAEITFRSRSEHDKLLVENLQSRHRELVRARVSGGWDVHVLVGGCTAEEVRIAAAVLCSAYNAGTTPYLLQPTGVPGALAETWADRQPGGDDALAPASPFLGTAEVVASLTSPPVRELPGIRLVTPLRFDVTPEGESGAGDGAPVLGQVLDASLVPVGPLRIPRSTLNRHTLICGATGSGKSQTARGLLEALSTAERPIPWLAVEPVKAEYARMAGRLGPDKEVLVIRPGDPSLAPASLNPLEPEPDYPLQSHADLVRALFLAAFEAHEPFPQVLSNALTQCYTRAGWNLVNGKLREPVAPKHYVDDADVTVTGRYPTLRDLQATAREVVDNIGYGKEVAADVRGFVDVRIGSLRQGAPGRFFEGGHPLHIGELLRRNAVLELENITNDQDKAFLIGAVLIRVVEHLRMAHQGRDADGLKHVLLIEEAHRLLKNVPYGPTGGAVTLFASLLAEIRAYGEGVVIVEQIPSNIVPDVIKNTALKVMHRLPAQDDRGAVGATMNLSVEQSDAVVSFSPGMAAVAFDGADRPLLVQMTEGLVRESSALCSTSPPLRGIRSRFCAADCADRPCTLQEIDLASAVAREATRTIWVEMVTVSLVTGLSVPMPQDRVRTAWLSNDRQRDCALAEAVERAIGAREHALKTWVDVDSFAELLHGILLAIIRGRQIPDVEPNRWRAGPYRWSDVYGVLKPAAAETEKEKPAVPTVAPTAEWVQRGLTFSGTSAPERLAELLNHPAYATDGRHVVLGDTQVSGLLQALGSVAGGTDYPRVRKALHHVLLAPPNKLLFVLRRFFPDPASVPVGG